LSLVMLRSAVLVVGNVINPVPLQVHQKRSRIFKGSFDFLRTNFAMALFLRMIMNGVTTNKTVTTVRSLASKLSTSVFGAKMFTMEMMMTAAVSAVASCPVAKVIKLTIDDRTNAGVFVYGILTGRLSTINLLVLTSVDQLLWIFQTLFTETNEEDNCRVSLLS